MELTKEQTQKLAADQLKNHRMEQAHKILDLAANAGHGSVTFYFAEPGVMKEKPRWSYVFNTDKPDSVMKMLETHLAIEAFCSSERELGEPFANNIKEVDLPLQED